MTRVKGVINSNDLHKVVKEMLGDLDIDIHDTLVSAGEKSAKFAVKLLRQDSPVLTGAYTRGWKLKREEGVRMGTRYIVHNSTNYQLTHLLEKGHVNRDGTTSKRFVHIAPVEKIAVKMFLDLVEEGIKNGS